MVLKNPAPDPPGPGPPAPGRGPARDVVTQWAGPRGFRGSKEARAGGASALLQPERGPASPSGRVHHTWTWHQAFTALRQTDQWEGSPGT